MSLGNWRLSPPGPVLGIWAAAVSKAEPLLALLLPLAQAGTRDN